MVRIPGRWHNNRLTRGTRMRHLAHVTNQESHPLVRLQDLHRLVVCRLFEALSIHLDDLVAYLRTENGESVYRFAISNVDLKRIKLIAATEELKKDEDKLQFLQDVRTRITLLNNFTVCFD